MGYPIQGAANWPAAVWVAIGSAIASAFFGVFAEPVRWFVYRPIIRLRFKPTKHYVTPTPSIITDSGTGETKRANSTFIRVSIKNVGLSNLPGCEAFLTKVEREEGGAWKPTAFIDPLRLPWSATEGEAKLKPRDLPQGVRFFVDVASTLEGGAALNYLARPELFRLEKLFDQPGPYLCTIAVTGNRVKPKVIRIRIKWAGRGRVTADLWRGWGWRICVFLLRSMGSATPRPMPDQPDQPDQPEMIPVSDDDVKQTLAYALTADIAAERLVKHLARAGFMVMRRPAGAGADLSGVLRGAGKPEE